MEKSTIVPAMLLKSLSIKGNFLARGFPRVYKHSFQYKKHFLKLSSNVNTSVTRVWLLRSYDDNKSSVSQKFSRTNCLSTDG